MTDVAEKTAVITGASRGLGAAMAKFFLAQGMNVAGCARSLPDLGSSDRSLPLAADVRDYQAISEVAEQATSRFGSIDLWINNAGVLAPIDMLRNIDSDEFSEHIAINVLGVFHGSKVFAQHVRGRSGGGVLVNISSGAAQSAYSGWSAYCAGKAAVERMSECLHLEEVDCGLRVHSVAPGVIDTDMQSLIRSTPAERFPTVEKFHQLKATESFNTGEFVAEKLLELAFSTTGASVVVDLPRR